MQSNIVAALDILAALYQDANVFERQAMRGVAACLRCGLTDRTPEQAADDTETYQAALNDAIRYPLARFYFKRLLAENLAFIRAN